MKTVLIIFLCPGLKFSDGLGCSCYDLKSLSHLEQERTELPSKFIVSPLWFKIRLLMSCACNYKFCNLIQALGSE